MASRAPAFPAHHPGDRTFFLGFLVFAWVGVLLGFVPPLAGRLAGRVDYVAPLILHIHAASFVAWMALLTTQILLIRTRLTAIHRRLGAFGAVLIGVPALLVSELLVSWIYHAPGWLPVAHAIATALPGPPV